MSGVFKLATGYNIKKSQPYCQYVHRKVSILTVTILFTIYLQRYCIRTTNVTIKLLNAKLAVYPVITMNGQTNTKLF